MSRIDFRKNWQNWFLEVKCLHINKILHLVTSFTHRRRKSQDMDAKRPRNNGDEVQFFDAVQFVESEISKMHCEIGEIRCKMEEKTRTTSRKVTLATVDQKLNVVLDLLNTMQK